eukprot:scaffold465_cov383-Pavlova_lutheri.AAC.3
MSSADVPKERSALAPASLELLHDLDLDLYGGAVSQAPPRPPRQLPPHRWSSRARSPACDSKKDYYAWRENVWVRFNTCKRGRVVRHIRPPRFRGFFVWA